MWETCPDLSRYPVYIYLIYIYTYNNTGIYFIFKQPSTSFRLVSSRSLAVFLKSSQLMSRCLGILVTKFYSTIALEICLGMLLYLTLRYFKNMSMSPCFAFIFTIEHIGCHSSILCLTYFCQGWSNPSFSPAFQVFPWPCRSWAITRSFLWSSSEVLYLWLSRFTIDLPLGPKATTPRPL